MLMVRKENKNDYAAYLFLDGGRMGRSFLPLATGEWTEIAVRPGVLEVRGTLRLPDGGEERIAGTWFYTHPRGDLHRIGTRDDDWAFRKILRYLRGKMSCLEFLPAGARRERLLAAMAEALPGAGAGLAEAALAYIQRERGLEEPRGRWKGAPGFSPWHPAPEERRDCCEDIRPPSYGYPDTLLRHCRTLKHVACLYGVGRGDLEQAVKRARASLAGAARLYLLGEGSAEDPYAPPSRPAERPERPDSWGDGLAFWPID